MNFTAIDFETSAGLIPCEIGICVVEDGRITDERSLLIKPYGFPYMNARYQEIHRISVMELERARTFDQMWDELFPYFDGQTLVAHNASFDISVLRTVLDLYDLRYPRSDYLCSLQMSRKVWKKLPAYNLNALCQRFDIALLHHYAGSDAKACAKLVLTAVQENQVSSLGELAEKVGITINTVDI
ncbi:MAG: 3'-5' exoribonuclease [Bacteroidales bacterium]|jgi:DNA polymerase-3 subunit epsilon|nr:3'-5' exoribonuclease [Bacteroidales bacterium]